MQLQITYNKMQRTKYYVLPSHNGWEGMMEGAIRASVVARNKDEVLERTIELARKREPSASKILSIFW